MRNCHKTIVRFAAATLPVVFGGSFVGADLVHITYFDQGNVNPATNGGPRWTGVVDTVTNNLQINTWIEKPGHGADFWVPRNLPLVWNALDSNGDPYDVPLSFGTTVAAGSPATLTATIGSDFGFFSPLTLAQMAWNEGAFTGPSGPSVLPGWGGVGLRDPLTGEFVYHTDSDPYSPHTLDESILLYLPVTATAPNISLDATIIVTGRTPSFAPLIFAVPEPSAFLGFGLIGSVCGASNWLRRRRAARGTAATA